MGIDATRPLGMPKEKFERAEIPRSQRVEEIIEKYRVKYGF